MSSSVIILEEDTIADVVVVGLNWGTVTATGEYVWSPCIKNLCLSISWRRRVPTEENDLPLHEGDLH